MALVDINDPAHDNECYSCIERSNPPAFTQRCQGCIDDDNRPNWFPLNGADREVASWRLPTSVVPSGVPADAKTSDETPRVRNVSVAVMTESGDRKTFYVSINRGDGESITPHVYTEEWQAEYEVAEYAAFFGVRALDARGNELPDADTILFRQPGPSSAAAHGVASCEERASPERTQAYEQGVAAMAKALRAILDGGACIASEPPELAEVAMLVAAAAGVASGSTVADGTRNGSSNGA